MTNRHMNDRSLFERALGDNWTRVAPVVRSHYGLRPNCDDDVKLEGVMSVYYPLPAFVLLAVARLLGGPVLLREDNIPVQVHTSSSQTGGAIYWHRRFKPRSKKKTLFFHSRMEYVSGNEIVEYIGTNSVFCMGIKMALREERGAIIFESTSYLLKVGPLHIPIPGHMFLGRAWIEEKAIAEQRIGMKFLINHPLWGRVYVYSGEFSICSSSAR